MRGLRGISPLRQVFLDSYANPIVPTVNELIFYVGKENVLMLY